MTAIALASTAASAQRLATPQHASERLATPPKRAAHAAHAGAAELAKQHRDPARAATPHGKASDEAIAPHARTARRQSPTQPHGPQGRSTPTGAKMDAIRTKVDHQYHALVAQLESQVDAETGGNPLDSGGLPTGDELAAELERFLRGQQ